MTKNEVLASKYEEFRDYIVRRTDTRKYDLEFFSQLYWDVLSYAQDHTMTVAKIILLSGMNSRDFYKAKNGEYDESLPIFLYKNEIEETDAKIAKGLPVYNGVILLTPSEIIEKLYLILEDKITEEMLETKNMPQVTSRIFLKKAVFGYSDQPQSQSQINVLNISDSQFDLAEKLLK